MLVLAAVLAGSLLSIARLRSSADSATRNEILQLRLSRSVEQLNGLEWEAAANRAESPHGASVVTAEIARFAHLAHESAADSNTASRARLLPVAERYASAVAREIAHYRRGDMRAAHEIDEHETDPTADVLRAWLAKATTHAERAARSQALKARKLTLLIAIGGGMAILLLLWRLNRGLIDSRRVQILADQAARLQELVVTDVLTDLRNQRAFHEDLEQDIAHSRRTETHLSLVMLDIDALKTINELSGTKAGDEYLKATAEAIRSTKRTGDRAYRIGGDEFAVILPATGQWDAFQFANRLHRVLAQESQLGQGLTAGVAEIAAVDSKDDLIEDADLALLNAKRAGQPAAIYAPDMKLSGYAANLEEDPHHIRTLANALAIAVDAKDSYTQSHSQTVANLCTSIAAELGFDAKRLSWIRIAGLLHDVGKIGIPDAILQKPATLDASEFALMKTHATVGESIVNAADMPQRALWIRHHHERVDGTGYPDGLAGEDIPLEARIIHVADAFEAMISDRPYRQAPGEAFAIEELRKNAGTQFDPYVVDALLRVLGERPLAQLLVSRASLRTVA